MTKFSFFIAGIHCIFEIFLVYPAKLGITVLGTFVLTLNWEPAAFFVDQMLILQICLTGTSNRDLKDQTGSLSFEIVNRNST